MAPASETAAQLCAFRSSGREHSDRECQTPTPVQRRCAREERLSGSGPTLQRSDPDTQASQESGTPSQGTAPEPSEESPAPCAKQQHLPPESCSSYKHSARFRDAL